MKFTLDRVPCGLWVVGEEENQQADLTVNSSASCLVLDDNLWDSLLSHAVYEADAPRAIKTRQVMPKSLKGKKRTRRNASKTRSS